jgi:septum formation protein
MQLVLASGSPRRRELLGRVGLDFEVVVPEVDESILPGEAPREHVARVARAKAEAISCLRPSSTILAADTMVVYDGESLGKPADDNEALAMLERLSGRSHRVVTAVCARRGERAAVHVAEASVSFVAASSELLRWYVATGEPRDKAGAYAVQGIGALLVERVEGNVQAVIGLPLAPLPDLFERIGLRLTPSGARLLLTEGPDRE